MKEQHAVNEELNALRDRLVNYVMGKFSNVNNIVELADDIVNQAIVECQQARTFTPGNLNFGYLAKICINLAIKHFRQQQWEQTNTVNFEDTHHKIDDDTRYVTLASADREVVLDTLELLREVEQKIVYLRYYHDYTFAEISAEMGMNINTVLTCHRRSLEKIRPRLTRFFDYTEPEDEEYPQRPMTHTRYKFL
jgi:RNA polymerase sigma-70 factor (ECF subfamily)